ncbi:MAG TPA: molybdopterin dinucleotide binding domain-containing protein, partial [Gaiellaceae bacterium]|nr:molybdopterin dinucleotide binding domain-containing protein [Gaiellaceae bacterium]
ERVPELQFQRPAAELELSPDDAERRSIADGDTVLARSNGTSVELRAHVNRRLLAGVVLIAEEHAADLHAAVEVVRA